LHDLDCLEESVAHDKERRAYLKLINRANEIFEVFDDGLRKVSVVLVPLDARRTGELVEDVHCRLKEFGGFGRIAALNRCQSAQVVLPGLIELATDLIALRRMLIENGELIGQYFRLAARGAGPRALV
jgi:hypothetical protein